MPFRVFVRDDRGAITVDWVALTAGILLLGIAVVYTLFETGVAGAAGEVAADLEGTSAIMDQVHTSGSGPFFTTMQGTSTGCQSCHSDGGSASPL